MGQQKLDYSYFYSLSKLQWNLQCFSKGQIRVPGFKKNILSLGTYEFCYSHDAWFWQACLFILKMALQKRKDTCGMSAWFQQSLGFLFANEWKEALSCCVCVSFVFLFYASFFCWAEFSWKVGKTWGTRWETTWPWYCQVFICRDWNTLPDLLTPKRQRMPMVTPLVRAMHLITPPRSY